MASTSTRTDTQPTCDGCGDAGENIMDGKLFRRNIILIHFSTIPLTKWCLILSNFVINLPSIQFNKCWFCICRSEFPQKSKHRLEALSNNHKQRCLPHSTMTIIHICFYFNICLDFCRIFSLPPRFFHQFMSWIFSSEYYMLSVITKPSVEFPALTNSNPDWPSCNQMFPVSPDSHADALGAHVAGRACGCYGTVSDRLLRDCVCSGQVWILRFQSSASRSTQIN